MTAVLGSDRKENSVAASAFASLCGIAAAAVLLTEPSAVAMPNHHTDIGSALRGTNLLALPFSLDLSTTNQPSQPLSFAEKVDHCLTNRLEGRILAAEELRTQAGKIEHLRGMTAIGYCLIGASNPKAAAKIDQLELVFRFSPPTVDLITLNGVPAERPLTSDLFCDTGKDGNHRFFIITIPGNVTRPQGELTAHLAKQILTAMEWTRYLDEMVMSPDKGLTNGRPPAEVVSEGARVANEQLREMAESFTRTSAALQEKKVAPASAEERSNLLFEKFAESFAKQVEELTGPPAQPPR